MIMNGYSTYLMIELAKCQGLIINGEEYDVAWAEGGILYEKFLNSKFNVETKSEYDCIVEFLEKEKDVLFQSIDQKSKEEELDLNIKGLRASEKGDGVLANTIWSLIELKGYERLDYKMNLLEMTKLKMG